MAAATAMMRPSERHYNWSMKSPEKMPGRGIGMESATPPRTPPPPPERFAKPSPDYRHPQVEGYDALVSAAAATKADLSALLQNIRGSLSAFRAELGALQKHSDVSAPADAKDVAACVVSPIPHTLIPAPHDLRPAPYTLHPTSET
jgi:hypothetical protein